MKKLNCSTLKSTQLTSSPGLHLPLILSMLQISTMQSKKCINVFMLAYAQMVSCRLVNIVIKLNNKQQRKKKFILSPGNTLTFGAYIIVESSPFQANKFQFQSFNERRTTKKYLTIHRLASVALSYVVMKKKHFIITGFSHLPNVIDHCFQRS